MSLVGRQIWRGALLLCDLLADRPHLVRGRRVMELAAGTGVTSVVAAAWASEVVATGASCQGEDRDSI